MIPESQSAVIARNETWRGQVFTEPYEACLLYTSPSPRD